MAWEEVQADGDEVAHRSCFPQCTAQLKQEPKWETIFANTLGVIRSQSPTFSLAITAPFPRQGCYCSSLFYESEFSLLSKVRNSFAAFSSWWQHPIRHTWLVPWPKVSRTFCYSNLPALETILPPPETAWRPTAAESSCKPRHVLVTHLTVFSKLQLCTAQVSTPQRRAE